MSPTGSVNRLIVATSNAGKVREIRARLDPLGINVQSLKDAGIKLNVIEDASTFAGNAKKKARAAMAAAGCPCLADDSGIEVDYLKGLPGVHSARFGGDFLSDKDRCLLLLKELSKAPVDERTARFRAALAYVEPSSNVHFFFGVLEGTIAHAPAGAHGFGYDPIFIPSGHYKTLAELGEELKNRISHRAKALDAFVNHLLTKQ